MELPPEIKAVQKAFSGNGWRKKAFTYFSNQDGIFISMHLSIYPTGQQNQFRISAERIVAKPMTVDPIYWDIAQLSDNKEQPLSFRDWAAFQCKPIEFGKKVIIVNAENDPNILKQKFLKWREKEVIRILDLFNRGFANLVSDPKINHVHEDTRKVQLMCALIAANQRDRAIELAQNNISRETPSISQGSEFILDGDEAVRLGFFELALLYLAGRDDFYKETKVLHRNMTELPIRFDELSFLTRRRVKSHLAKGKYHDLEKFAAKLAYRNSDSSIHTSLWAWALMRMVDNGIHIDNMQNDISKAIALFESSRDMPGFKHSKETLLLRGSMDALESRVKLFYRTQT